VYRIDASSSSSGARPPRRKPTLRAPPAQGFHAIELLVDLANPSRGLDRAAVGPAVCKRPRSGPRTLEWRQQKQRSKPTGARTPRLSLPAVRGAFPHAFTLPPRDGPGPDHPAGRGVLGGPQSALAGAAFIRGAQGVTTSARPTRQTETVTRGPPGAKLAAVEVRIFCWVPLTLCPSSPRPVGQRPFHVSTARAADPAIITSAVDRPQPRLRLVLPWRMPTGLFLTSDDSKQAAAGGGAGVGSPPMNVPNRRTSNTIAFKPDWRWAYFRSRESFSVPQELSNYK